MKRITLSILIIMLVIALMPAGLPGAPAEEAFAATTISTIDLTYDADKVVNNTHLTEAEVNYAFLETMGTTTKGVELIQGESTLMREWSEEGTWGAVASDAYLDDRFVYALSFGMYLSDGYDLPSSVTSYTGHDVYKPAKISDFPDLTIKVNGAKKENAAIYYNQVTEDLRALIVFVPFDSKPSTEEIKPTINEIKIFDMNGEDISGKTIELGAGDTYTFSSEVNGLRLDDEAYKKVSWTVTGAAKTGTTMDATTGKLTIASDEPASTGAIKVIATSTYDNTKSQSTSVTVREGLTIDRVVAGVSAGFTTKAFKGADTEIWAVAEGSHPNKTISWTLTGNKSADTKIIPNPNGAEGQWVLKVAKDETATTLTAKAYSNYDNSKYDTITFTVNNITYIKTVNLNYDVTKLGLSANASESDVNRNVPKAISVDVTGMTLSEQEIGIVKIYPTGVEGAGEIKLDPTKDYYIYYGFHLDEGYDVPDSYKKYKHPDLIAVENLSGLTVNVNGTKNGKVYFQYADEYRTVYLMAPISKEVAAAVPATDDGGTVAPGEAVPGSETDDASDNAADTVEAATINYGTIDTGITKGNSKTTVKLTGLKDKTYTGKKIKQTLTLKYKKTKLKVNKDYKLTYKNNKNVGLATITIKGLGKYKGTFKQTFRIIPKKAAISKVTPTTKAATVKWKAIKTKMSKKKITGYQVQYSTSSKFKASVTKLKNVKGAAKKSVKITKLKAKKKYYFRIRTYMKVGKKTYYSKWSAKKSAKVK